MDKKRPVGITILAILSLIGGIGMTMVLAFQLRNILDFSFQFESTTGISSLILLPSIVLLIFVELGAGIGLFLGKFWGWFLAAFYFAHSILRYANAVLFAGDFLPVAGAPPEDLDKATVKYGGRIIINSLIFCYFFKGNVLQYFGIEKEKRFKLVLKIIGLAIGVFSVFAIIDILTGPVQ